MDARQKRKGEYARMLLQRSPLSRNQVAAVSGLSNAYIRELEKGSIGNVGREKLIAFAIALNLSLLEIDRMLAVFDRAALTDEDIPIFVDATRRSRISAALHPIHDSFTFDLAVLCAERIPGEHVIVSPRPASCLREEGHRIYAEKPLVEAHPLYADLVAAIIRERRRLLGENLVQFALRQYVCINCLEDYLLRCEDPVEKQWRIGHLANTIEMIRRHRNFHFSLTRECPSFIFVLRTPPPGAKATEKLIITALPPHRFKLRSAGSLAGFATDNQAVILNFKEELAFIRTTVIEAYRDRHRLVGYLESLVNA